LTSEIVALWSGSLLVVGLLVFTAVRSLRAMATTGEEAVASREARFVAFLVDTLVLAALAGPVVTIAVVAKGLGVWHEADAFLYATAALPLLGLTFQAYLVVTRGQTIGKRLTGITVVRLDGERVSFARGVLLRVVAMVVIYGVVAGAVLSPVLIMRLLAPAVAVPDLVLVLLALVAVVAILVDPLFIFGTEQRCLHDRLAGTKVVVAEAREHSAHPLRTLAWWLGVLVGLVFPALTTITMYMPEPALGRFDLVQEVMRITSLACGVVLVIFMLAALLPLVLDGLERGTFITFVSARLVRAKKSGFLTAVSVLSILAVSLSSCALCSVTSIMGGFGHDLKRKILGNTAHIIVEAGPAGFEGWRPVLASVREAVAPFGGTATPVVGGDAMASSSTNTAGVLMRGVDPETIGQVINLHQNIEIGKFDYLTDPSRLLELGPDEIIGRGPGGEPFHKGPGFSFPTDLDPGVIGTLPERKVYPGVILGRELAKSLHVMVGDDLTILSPMGELGPMGIMPKARKFRVAGIFYSGMYEYDASHAYVLLDVAQGFFDIQSRISRVDVRIPIPEKVDQVRPVVDGAVAALNARRASRQGHKELLVKDWKEMNKNLFSALALEKVATFIILSIAIAVASFCIICTLLLMVTEKEKEIAVLKALGAPDGAIRAIFVLEGVLIGGIGTVLGVSVALAASLGLAWTGVRLDPEVYYIDRLPVNVDAFDYSMVALASLVICTVATIYPAVTAARVQPVEGLRYE
jgi:lipoprotein-releasing system permease protein